MLNIYFCKLEFFNAIITLDYYVFVYITQAYSSDSGIKIFSRQKYF